MPHTCTDCRIAPVCRPQTSCRDCYVARERAGRRLGHGLGVSGHALPDAPTDAPPGSPEKVAELERRAAAGVRLWHPADRGRGRRYE
jgi:hypothetical protein